MINSVPDEVEVTAVLHDYITKENNNNIYMNAVFKVVTQIINLCYDIYIKIRRLSWLPIYEIEKRIKHHIQVDSLWNSTQNMNRSERRKFYVQILLLSKKRGLFYPIISHIGNQAPKFIANSSKSLTFLFTENKDPICFRVSSYFKNCVSNIHCIFHTTL